MTWSVQELFEVIGWSWCANVLLPKINVTLNISVALKQNMKSLSLQEEEKEGELQLSGRLVFQGGQSTRWEGG